MGSAPFSVAAYPSKGQTAVETKTGQKHSGLLACKFTGAPDTIRTYDTRFRRAVLYPLSYGGK